MAPIGPKYAGRIRRWWDRLLSGPMPSDPLYLSNRTWKQKLRLGLGIGLPALIAVGAITYALFTPPPAVEKRVVEPSAAEIVAKAPIIPKDFKIEQSNDLQVMEVGVDRTSLPHHITGLLRNNSGMRLGSAELSFDLTDEKGSTLGSAVAIVEDIPPLSTVRFGTAIPQRHVAYVLVREMHSSLRRRP